MMEQLSLPLLTPIYDLHFKGLPFCMSELHIVDEAFLLRQLMNFPKILTPSTNPSLRRPSELAARLLSLSDAMFYPLRLTPFTSSLSRSYIIPALLLNPILFLHTINAILSRILPPIAVPNVAVQPPPYHPKGPSAEHPHLDIHASANLCWSYTIVMVGVQIVAFGKVSMRREERKERVRRKKQRIMLATNDVCKADNTYSARLVAEDTVIAKDSVCDREHSHAKRKQSDYESEEDVVFEDSGSDVFF